MINAKRVHVMNEKRDLSEKHIKQGSVHETNLSDPPEVTRIKRSLLAQSSPVNDRLLAKFSEGDFITTVGKANIHGVDIRPLETF